MSALIEVILPVFLVIGFGYVAVWRGLFSDASVDGLMRFTQTFALPCLLFKAMSDLDLSQNFSLALLGSFYTGALACFLCGTLGGRYLFKRDWEDAIAIGFCALFSNTLLLGIPITERAYGTDALAGNFAIIAMHAPFGYFLGITAMEIVRNQGGARRQLPWKVLNAMFHNSLIIGIVLGLAVNLSGVALPVTVTDAIDLMVRAALPAALFGLGGVLYRYRPEGDMRAILFVCAISLGLHPLFVWTMGRATGLDIADFRSAILTAAMAPGVNAYVFANMYGRARRVVASSVLIATVGSVLTIWGWLYILP
ncbi:malonate transporter [Loktanella sp. 3ANDIMAR09]|uniref:AEC family transporter n=1 Tax=Loktanella sp. 3ANDIMAR09 TaxID=1225657 RepID=UPI0006F3A34D|nr:AEC family transporter [Loktanella sp. 3ANDIMAR09]KQI68881.1 malonate transporter [Loktanella sp. 3ANDIMAR09]